jgi:hypothetical protein
MRYDSSMAIRRNHHTAPSRYSHASLVYFLVRGDLIKIGTTCNLPRRCRSMQQPLTDVLAVLPGSYDVESAWHDRFRHLQDTETYGGREWFRATDELLEAIADAATTTRAAWDAAVAV